jgi:hypothetical protein
LSFSSAAFLAFSSTSFLSFSSASFLSFSSASFLAFSSAALIASLESLGSSFITAVMVVLTGPDLLLLNLLGILSMFP